MGFSMVFSSFRLVSDHVNVNVITYQNWILRKRLGDITEFYGEGPRVPRVPGLANCQTGNLALVMGHVAMTLDMAVTRFEKMFLEQEFCLFVYP